jgi:hypothetical protein
MSPLYHILTGRPVGCTPPSFLFERVRIGWLRRYLLRRQNQLDGVTCNYSVLFIEDAFSEGRLTWTASYSVLGQGKKYHWEEIASSHSTEKFFATLPKRIHRDTREVCYLTGSGLFLLPNLLEHGESTCLRLLKLGSRYAIYAPGLRDLSLTRITVSHRAHCLVTSRSVLQSTT